MAIIAAIALLAFVVTRIGGGGNGGGGGGGSGEVPDIHFQVGTVKASSIGPGSSLKTANAVLPKVEGVIKAFYQAAFLDPENWQNGTYDSAWETFTGSEAKKAQAQIDTLTLGENAGDTYSSITPKPSLFGLRVLTDRQGEVVSAFALVTFAAIAEKKSGGQATIVSTGQYSLEPQGDSWKITGFQVKREDRGATDGTPAQGESPSPGMQVGLAHPAEDFPALTGSTPVNILVLGDSYRAGQSHLADSIHILSVNPDSGGATMIGIPRDSYVPILGHGTQKINAAYSIGGKALMIQTIEQLTGLHIDFYAITTFGGFVSIVKDVGGIEMKIPYAIHDPGSRADLNKGETTLNGNQALQLARARDDVPNGDFSRQYNEGLELMGMRDGFQKTFSTDPSVVLQWVGTGLANVETDLSFDQVMGLAFLAAQIKTADVNNIVVPGTIGVQNGESIVRISPSAQAIFTDVKDNGILDQHHQGANV